jgi:hypothetical protein
MKVARYILWTLAVGVAIIQFIRPHKNISQKQSSGEITTSFTVPKNVQEVLQTSCYDCHSNSTRYPWYAEVQPVGWWLNNHIDDGKRKVNFSEFAAYPLRRQYRKFDEMIKQVNGGEMPLPSYLFIHTEAKLSQGQKDAFIAWANAMRDSMQAHYPPDSLIRKQ